MPSTRYVGTKYTEEAKIAIEVIKAHHLPDMDAQDINSLAVMEYVHAYYPSLEKTIAEIVANRRRARRGDTTP